MTKGNFEIRYGEGRFFRSISDKGELVYDAFVRFSEFVQENPDLGRDGVENWFGDLVQVYFLEGKEEILPLEGDIGDVVIDLDRRLVVMRYEDVPNNFGPSSKMEDFLSDLDVEQLSSLGRRVENASAFLERKKGYVGIEYSTRRRYPK